MQCLFQYAQWEEAQKDFRRARSVWERALDINYRNVPYWLKVSTTEHRTQQLMNAHLVFAPRDKFISECAFACVGACWACGLRIVRDKGVN